MCDTCEERVHIEKNCQDLNPDPRYSKPKSSITLLRTAKQNDIKRRRTIMDTNAVDNR